MEQEDYSKLHHVSSKAFFLLTKYWSRKMDGKMARTRRWEHEKFQHSRVSKRLVKKNEG
jgi:hypothetical protein